jgi:hypothetical protein
MFGFRANLEGFYEMDKSTGPKQCTEGVWAKVDNKRKLVIFDVEGGDSKIRHQNGEGTVRAIPFNVLPEI